jgi:hypothetical protein
MAPEQESGHGEGIDARVDVFALGGLLRFLANDGRPLPRRLTAIIEHAVAPDRNERYPGVVELSADVARFSSGATVSAYRESFGERVVRLASRHRTAILLVAAYLVMRLLFLVYARA